MTLYYAMGGGLGHLTRARAVAHTLGLADVTLVTASAHAADTRVTGRSRVVAVPPEFEDAPEALAGWLSELLARLAPASIHVDVFPFGIQGELGFVEWPADARRVLIARSLRWARYRSSVPASHMSYHTCHVVEPLPAEYMQFLQHACDRIETVRLVDPPDAHADTNLQHLLAIVPDERPLWLVVHAGAHEEVEELLAYAMEIARMESADPFIVVIAPTTDEPVATHVPYLDIYPATSLFPRADRIISACGFNIMRQTEPWRDRHRPVPFARTYDDQFARRQRMR